MPRFTLERELGRGGGGVVWLARDQFRGGERVALKRPGGGTDVERLRREFDAARRLRHPAIVAVRDFGVDGEGPFLTMEYVEGEDLSARVGRLPPERVARIAGRLGDALEYARRRGFVHGDLKPGNIRIPAADPEGVKLLDLGFARLLGGRAEGGTPEYLAPEVLAGRPVDGRADLFALGVVLYECLTGAPPWRGFERGPAPPLPPAVPEALRRAIERLLAPRAEDRPGRASDLVALLGDAPGLRLPLPEGDLVGRDALLARALAGERLLVEAPPGSGRDRLRSELREQAEARGVALRVALYAPGQAPHPAGVEVVALEPLDRAAMEQLVASRLPLEPAAAHAVAAWALAESAGLPALAVEALEALRDSGLLQPGPLGLSCDASALAALQPERSATSRVGRWIAALPPEQREERAKAAILAPAADLPAMLARGLEDLLPAPRRAELHGQGAEAELRRDPPDPVRLVAHLRAAGREVQAAIWQRRAGEQLRARGDRRAARAAFEQAGALLAPGGERARARLELGRELALAGEGERALEQFRLAREEDSGLAVACQLGAAELLAARREGREARRAAVAALRGSRGPGGEAERAQALLVLGRLAASEGLFEGARRHLEAALCLSRRIGDVAAAGRASMALGNTAFRARHWDQALEDYRAALQAARSSGDRRGESLVLQNLAMIYAYHRREAREARPAIESAVAMAEAEGDSGRLARALVHLAVLEMDSGRPDEALRHVERALALRVHPADRADAVSDRIFRGEILTLVGRFAEARDSLHCAAEEAAALGDRRREATALHDLGLLALETTDPAAARSYFERAVLVARAGNERGLESSAVAGLALACSGLRQFEEAQRILAASSRGEAEDAEASSRLCRAHASVALGLGRPAEAVRWLEMAMAPLGAAGYQLELARTLLLLGQVRSQERDHEAALDAFERARSIFDRFGAKPALARAILAKAKSKLKAVER